MEEMPSTEPHTREDGFDSQFNWVWIAEVRDDRAIEVLGPDAAPDPRLDRLFARVDRCRPAPGFRLEVDDAAADVVVLGDLLPGLADAPAGGGRGGRPGGREAAVLAECRRVLRDGGLVQLGIGNALWHRHLRRRLDPRGSGSGSGHRASPAAVRRWLRSAGFGEVRVYHVSPRSGLPEGLIPDSPRTLEAHERIRGTATGMRRLARRLLARAGLGSLLHPRLLVLGLV